MYQNIKRFYFEIYRGMKMHKFFKYTSDDRLLQGVIVVNRF